jgi:hypothetical protein
MPAHTPTPWQVTEDPMAEGQPLTLVIPASAKNPLHEKWIALCWERDEVQDEDLPGRVEAEANAAFIVRAVNAHDELVEALCEIEKRLAVAVQRNPRKIYSEAFEIAQAALAKAKGGAS